MSLFETITAAHEKRYIADGRARAIERRVIRSWKAFHLQWQINTYRPATTAKPDENSCVVSTSGAAARVERQGGAN